MCHLVRSFSRFNGILCLTLTLCLAINLFKSVELRSQNSTQAISLTLQEAIYRALSYNNHLRASEFAINRANWDKKYALRLFLPRLSFNTRFTRIDDRDVIVGLDAEEVVRQERDVSRDVPHVALG